VKLSIIVPAFNEERTIVALLDAVRAVDLGRLGLEREVVVVSDGSTDATASLARAQPGVAVHELGVNRGKGAAVRHGIRHATGDLILIQDADLEYSVGDYPKLIHPIRRGDVDFTLGCRHVPGQRMRVMDEMRNVARIVNMAHWVFTWFFNVTYRTRLRDPFTMFKVFRTECLEGVTFVSDRFDFDWELTAKLVRLGYRPIEIPVEYDARSFHGGKKVRFFRDPPTWIAACLRFRFCALPRQGDLLAPQSAERRDQIARRRGELVSDRHSDAMEG